MRTQAIILKKIPIKEYDELVVGYTDTAGKQIYQAKSVTKPTSVQGGHLDLFNLVDFALVGSGSAGSSSSSRAIITGAHSLRAYSHLKSSLPALAVGYFLLEAFDRLVFEGEVDKGLWNYLTGWLERLDSDVKIGRNIGTGTIQSARQDLLTVLGYDPTDSLEAIAGRHFHSLQFARKVLG